MEKRIEKLLQSQNYGKELCISGGDQPNIIDCIQKIQNVPLENLNLWDIEKEFILHIFNAFKNLKKLRTIECKIDSEIANCITSIIPNLTSIDLDCDKMQTDAFITIIDAIKCKHSCSALTLSMIIFDKNKTAVLIDCIERGQLVNLELHRCSFKCDVDALVSVMGAIVRSPLQTLCLGDIDFNYTITSAMVHCITNSHLIKLSLSECTFVNDKIATIMAAIQSSAIQSLDISSSYFADDISDVMKCVHNSNVTKFIFGTDQRRYCNEKMIAIANSIRNGNLLKVGFNYTNISEEIFDSIKSSSIISLDLYPNPFDDEAGAIKINVAAICDLLEQCKLRKLKIALKEIDDAHIQTILSSIKKSELIKLHVHDAHCLSAHIKQEIKETMRKQKLRAATFNKMKSANTNTNVDC